MWVERLIEGDRNARMRRDRGPTTADKVWRKLAKHARLAGHRVLDRRRLDHVLRRRADAWCATSGTGAGRRTAAYFFIGLFTVTTYLLAGWAREQVCTFMCPWPRFQAAMLDEQSLIVTYQAWRGEPRGHGKARRRRRRARPLHRLPRLRARLPDRHRHPRRRPARMHQLRAVRRRLQRDDGEDRPAQMAGHLGHAGGPEGQGRGPARARSGCCARAPSSISAPWWLHWLVMGIALATRARLDLAVLHDRAPLFVRVRDGGIRNGYTLKISNKTEMPAAVRADARAGWRTASDGTWPSRPSPREAASACVASMPTASAPSACWCSAARPRWWTARRSWSSRSRNLATGEQTTYTSVFIGPGGASR